MPSLYVWFQESDMNSYKTLFFFSYGREIKLEYYSSGLLSLRPLFSAKKNTQLPEYKLTCSTLYYAMISKDSTFQHEEDFRPPTAFRIGP